jgi:hypothetical protein
VDAKDGIWETMILHNYICEHKSDDIDFDHVECDKDYELTLPERYKKYVVSSDRSTPLPNAPTTGNFHDELATAISLG